MPRSVRRKIAGAALHNAVHGHRHFGLTGSAAQRLEVLHRWRLLGELDTPLVLREPGLVMRQVVEEEMNRPA